MPRELPWPAFLSSHKAVHHCRISSVIAFADCDLMGICWHGNLLKYCELAREALGRRLGFDAKVIQKAGLLAPVVRQQVLHHHILRPGQAISIEARLYPSPQARLYHRYSILLASPGQEPRLAAEAETEQVLVNQAYELVLAQPATMSKLLATPPD